MSNKKHYYCNAIRWKPELGGRARKDLPQGYSECRTPSKKFIIRKNKILGFCERCSSSEIKDSEEIMGQPEAKVAEVIYG